MKFTSGSLPTKYQYTGQYSNMSDFGLMFYIARWFDPALGRFSSADTIVPGAGNPAAWDRYAGMLNNPINYIDPTGHGCIMTLNGKVCSDLYPDIGFTVNVAEDRKANTKQSQYAIIGNKYLTGNACGFIAVEIVAEAIFGFKVPLVSIYTKFITTGLITPYHVANLVQQTVPFAMAQVRAWRKDAINEIISCLNHEKLVIAYVRVDPETGRLIAQEFIKIEQGVYDQTKLANHYVVVKEINHEYVIVINPFNNAEEKYTTTEFSASFAETYVVITPPPNKNPIPV